MLKTTHVCRWMVFIVTATQMVPYTNATVYTWNPELYAAGHSAMFAGNCADPFGHVFEVTNATAYQYSIDSNGNYRQPFHEFLDAINSRRCLHHHGYQKAHNLRWVKAMAEDARAFLATNPASTSVSVTSIGTKSYLRHDYIGSSPSQIEEIVSNWYATKRFCIDDPDVGADGCMVSPGPDDDLDPDDTAEAYIRMIWHRARTLGCACVGSKVACIIDAGQDVDGDITDTAVISATSVDIVSMCSLSNCSTCDEVGGGACKTTMVPATRTNVTLDSCLSQATVSPSIVPNSIVAEDDEDMEVVAIVMIVVFSVILAILVAVAITYRRSIYETLMPVLTRHHVSKFWKTEQKGATQLAMARQNQLTISREVLRQQSVVHKKSQASMMLSPMFNPMVDAPAEGSVASLGHETAPAHHYLSSKDVLNTHRTLVERNKVLKQRSTKDQETVLRERATDLTEARVFTEPNEVTL